MDADDRPAGAAHGAVEIDPALCVPPFDWDRVFGNPQPVELEIGCGKGKFLIEIARQRPAVNFLGVERAGKYYRKAVARLGRAALGNARLLRADGLDLLDRWVSPGSVRCIHIYFPDPWPKKRHHKRRIFRTALLQLAARALPSGGELRLATDDPNYAAIIQALFEEQTTLFEQTAWPEDDPQRLPTHYSLKWQRAGRTLWYVRYRRTALPLASATWAAASSPLAMRLPDATFRSTCRPLP